MSAVSPIHRMDPMTGGDRVFEVANFTVSVHGEDVVTTCDVDEPVRVKRDTTGLIKVMLAQDMKEDYEMLPLVFEGSKEVDIRQIPICNYGVLIWDKNNLDKGLGQRKVKFSIFLRRLADDEIFFMDPIIINE